MTSTPEQFDGPDLVAPHDAIERCETFDAWVFGPSTPQLRERVSLWRVDGNLTGTQAIFDWDPVVGATSTGPYIDIIAISGSKLFGYTGNDAEFECAALGHVTNGFLMVFDKTTLAPEVARRPTIAGMDRFRVKDLWPGPSANTALALCEARVDDDLFAFVTVFDADLNTPMGIAEIPLSRNGPSHYGILAFRWVYANDTLRVALRVYTSDSAYDWYIYTVDPSDLSISAGIKAFYSYYTHPIEYYFKQTYADNPTTVIWPDDVLARIVTASSSGGGGYPAATKVDGYEYDLAGDMAYTRNISNPFAQAYDAYLNEEVYSGVPYGIYGKPPFLDVDGNAVYHNGEWVVWIDRDYNATTWRRSRYAIVGGPAPWAARGAEYLFGGFSDADILLATLPGSTSAGLIGPMRLERHSKAGAVVAGGLTPAPWYFGYTFGGPVVPQIKVDPDTDDVYLFDRTGYTSDPNA